MRGVPSVGMVLCASNATHDQVTPLQAPEDAAVGERVWFGEGNEQQVRAHALKVKQSKAWELHKCMMVLYLHIIEHCLVVRSTPAPSACLPLLPCD